MHPLPLRVDVLNSVRFGRKCLLWMVRQIIRSISHKHTDFKYQFFYDSFILWCTWRSWYSCTLGCLTGTCRSPCRAGSPTLSGPAPPAQLYIHLVPFLPCNRGHVLIKLYKWNTMQGKSHLCIPFLGIAWPQS